MTETTPDLRGAAATSAPRVESYDSRTVLFHWLVAVLIAVQWLGAHTIDWFPKGDLRTGARSVHIVLGSLLALLIVLRLGWRWTGGRKLPPADHGALRVLAISVQGLLYVLVIATVALGLLNAFVRGDSVFGLFHIPKLAADAGFRSQVQGLHELAANAILVVAAVHSGAALIHHYLWHDGLLGRMIPALARSR